MEILDIVKPRPDRNDPNKTHWDPIGVLFRNDEGRLWGQIYAIGEINVYPRKKRNRNMDDSAESGPFG